MERTRSYIVVFVTDAVLLVLLYFCTHILDDALVMIYISLLSCVICVGLFCFCFLVRTFRRYAFPILLNAFLLPISIYAVFQLATYCRIQELYTIYNFHTISNEYSISLHKHSNEFNICRMFENGSEGVVYGTYVSLGNNQYMLTSDSTCRFKGGSVYLIKKDSIYGFNEESYSLKKE